MPILIAKVCGTIWSIFLWILIYGKASPLWQLLYKTICLAHIINNFSRYFFKYTNLVDYLLLETYLVDCKYTRNVILVIEWNMICTFLVIYMTIRKCISCIYAIPYHKMLPLNMLLRHGWEKWAARFKEIWMSTSLAIFIDIYDLFICQVMRQNIYTSILYTKCTMLLFLYLI